VLQTYAILKLMEDGSPPSKAAMASVFISALTTGLVSKNISWNYDTDPQKRRTTPEFYGYLPSGNRERAIVSVCMVVNSSALLLLRSFAAALLMLVEKRYFVLYLVIDMAVYLLQVRRANGPV